MDVFVTGATGVIGRRVVPALSTAGHDVTAVGRNEPKREQLRAQGARPIDVDLFDRDAVRRAVDGHEAVINLATHIPSSARAALPGAWRTNDRLRTEAAEALVDAAIAAGATRFVQESLAFMYADGGSEWLTEESPIDAAFQMASALTAEGHTARFAGAGGVGVVLRFGLFVAPDSAQTRDMVTFARRGIFALPGAADGYVAFVHADDAAAAVVAALDAPGGTYNVLEDEPATRAQHAAAWAEYVGRPVRVAPAAVAKVPAMRALGRSQRVSNSAFRVATGWAPRYPELRRAWPQVADAVSAATDDDAVGR